MTHTNTPDDEPTGDDPRSIEPAQGTSGDRATWIAAALILVVGALAIGLVVLTG